MKRIAWLLLALLLTVTAACAKPAVEEEAETTASEETVEAAQPVQPVQVEEADEESAPVFDYLAYDWLTHMEGELFDDSALGMLIADTAALKITDITDREIAVTVSAPDVYDAIKAWFDTVDDAEFSVDAMDAEIRRLLAGNAVEETFALPYELVGNAPMIYYTDEFLHAASCGLLSFYQDLYADMAEELGGAANA